MKNVIIITLIKAVVWVVLLSGYAMNLAKIRQCDFNPPYKCEIIRYAGVLWPIGGATGWIDISSK